MRIKRFNISFGSQFFKALSDESRLRILYLLSNNDMLCISDIELVLDFTQTKTSRHIGYLKNSNMVLSKKVDQYVFYFLNPQVVDFIENIFSYLKYDDVLTKDLENCKIMHSNRELKSAKLKLQRKI